MRSEAGKRIEQSSVKEFSDENRIEIYLDSREIAELKEEIERHGVTVNVKQLEFGDALISNKVIIERKTANDFESSIIDGRLFEQASRISENYEIAILILEGPMRANRIRQNAFMGAYLSLITDFGLHVINSKDMHETAHYIYLLAKREQLQEKRPIRLLSKRKAVTPAEMKLRVIESFPRIGPATSKKLIEHYSTLDKLFNSDIKELERTIGKAKANEMHALIHKE
mgnify:CR=1 FL=1